MLHAAQVAMEAAPVAEEKRPAGHAEQAALEVAPVAFRKVPAGQLMQSEELPGL